LSSSPTPCTGAAISSSGWSILPARCFRFAGGIRLADTAIDAVLNADSGALSTFPAPGTSWSMSSENVRAPAPSDTTALSSSFPAAVSSIISPPTDSPIPPIRSGSTSGRRWRKSIAASTSL
jgi:hypothetical protein